MRVYGVMATKSSRNASGELSDPTAWSALLNELHDAVVKRQVSFVYDFISGQGVGTMTRLRR